MALTDILGQVVVGCIEPNSTLSVGAQKKDSEAEIGKNSIMQTLITSVIG